MASGAPDWQRVVTLVAPSMTHGAPDWERTVVGPGGIPVGGSSGWGVRLAQTINQQSFISGAYTEVGWDTLVYQTRGTAPTFNSVTIGGHAYAYTEMNAPDAGYYDVQLTAMFNIVPTGMTFMEGAGFVEVAGPAVAEWSTPSYPTSSGSNTSLTVVVRDIVHANVNDVIDFAMNQTNANGAALGVSTNPTATYALIRYLGTT